MHRVRYDETLATLRERAAKALDLPVESLQRECLDWVGGVGTKLIILQALLFALHSVHTQTPCPVPVLMIISTGYIFVCILYSTL